MRKPLAIAFLFFLFSLFSLPQLAFGAQAEQSTALDAKYADYAQFIVIDKSSNKLYYYEEGKLIKSFAVATGKKPSYTPEGLFFIREKVKNRPYYKEHIKGGDPNNPLGDRWLGLEVQLKDGTTSYAYGIHGTNNESSIGKHVSNGCIRMHNESIHWLYDKIKVKTKVLIRK